MFTGIVGAILMAALTGHSDDELSPPPHNPESPLTITIAGPTEVRGPRDLELVLEIRRDVPDEVPMSVRVTLPAGVVQRAGTTEFVLADAHERVLVQRIPLHVNRVPDGDVVVTVDARSAAYGVHATTVYRFGRAAPVARRVPVGSELRGPGGAILGRPIQIDRTRSKVAPR